MPRRTPAGAAALHGRGHSPIMRLGAPRRYSGCR